MNLTPDQARALTHRLASDLQLRIPETRKRLDYMQGKQGRLRFASEKFQQYFAKRFDGFADNWCAPVVEAPVERTIYLGTRPADSTSAHVGLSRAWERAGADAGLQEALLVRAAVSRAFVMVSPGVREDHPRVTFEHPETTIVDADPATGARRAALTMWADDQHEYATLYTPTEVWKWQRASAETREMRRDRKPDPMGGWEPRRTDSEGWPLSNPLGEVPIVEMPNRSFLDPLNPLSEITGVMGMQDAMNLVWAYLLNALDGVSMPQRIVTGAASPTVPVLDDNGQIIGERPVELDSLTGEKILWIPGTTAKIAEWSAAQIEPFAKVIDRAVKHIAAQTRTPPHYLSGDLINAAAETLTISEAGLVSRTTQSMMFLNPALRTVNRLMALAMRLPTNEVESISAGQIMYKDPQYRSEAQRADALVKKRQMGYPFKWILEQDGLSPSEIERVMQMRREELLDDPFYAAELIEDGFAQAPSTQGERPV